MWLAWQRGCMRVFALPLFLAAEEAVRAENTFPTVGSLGEFLSKSRRKWRHWHCDCPRNSY
eukprot:1473763-Rhodomonas_salina.1